MSTPFFHRSAFASPSRQRRGGSAPQLQSPEIAPSYRYSPFPGTPGAGTSIAHVASSRSEHPFFSFPLYASKEELMEREDPLAFAVLEVVSDEDGKKKFLREAASADKRVGYETQDGFEKGIDALKTITRSFKQDISCQRIYYQQKLEQVDRSFAVITDLEENTIPAAAKLAKQAEERKTGKERPEMITESWLKDVFTYNDYNVIRSSSAYIAAKMFVNGWDDITLIGKEESFAILSFLSDKEYAWNDHCFQNVLKYKNHRILPSSFAEREILRNKRHSTKTLQGLLGIYFGMLPDDAVNFTFTQQYSEDKDPWTPKAGTPAAGAPSAASGETTGAASAGSDMDEL